jgi:hypothetical protein
MNMDKETKWLLLSTALAIIFLILLLILINKE